jgi:TRIAD3 protein (E3 ubiquitin-protein ligase RNF216)
MAKVRAENPGVSDADLMIQVSDRVKNAEDARKGRARAEVNAFPYHMVNDQLQRRLPLAFAQLGQPPAPAQPPVNQYVPVHPYPVAAVPAFNQPVGHPVPMAYHHHDLGLAPQQPHQYVWYNHHPLQPYVPYAPPHYYQRPPNPPR